MNSLRATAYLTVVLTACACVGDDKTEKALPVGAVRAFENLIFDRPIVLTHADDGTNRVFVAEQKGFLRVFPNDPDVEEASVFLDIHNQCHYRDNRNEEGLLGFALHPDYRNNGHLFVYYTSETAADGAKGRSLISRFTVSKDDPNKVDPQSETEIMRIEQPYWNHNGGTIAFGPDGYLYIGLGDGGSGNDPEGNGQNLATLLGSILRIDVDSKTEGYSIPDDNPFIDKKIGVARKKEIFARPEIYAYGLRNVWRMSFDRETGALWAADVGQNLWEEINIITSGGNYGWNIREARHWFYPKGNDEKSDTMVDPIWEYHHSVGKSITGGHVYRGEAVPELVGKYVYADYVSGLLWALEHDGEKSVSNYSLTGIVDPDSGDSVKLPVMSFGEDEVGEVYFMTAFGQVYTFQSQK